MCVLARRGERARLLLVVPESLEIHDAAGAVAGATGQGLLRQSVAGPASLRTVAFARVEIFGLCGGLSSDRPKTILIGEGESSGGLVSGRARGRGFGRGSASTVVAEFPSLGRIALGAPLHGRGERDDLVPAPSRTGASPTSTEASGTMRVLVPGGVTPMATDSLPGSRSDPGRSETRSHFWANPYFTSRKLSSWMSPMAGA